jgi:hypothetical protein
MQMKRILSYGLILWLLGTGAVMAQDAPGESVGKAIGNGVKAFANSVFPGATPLLDLLGTWLKAKLTPKDADKAKLTPQQADQIKAGAQDLQKEQSKSLTDAKAQLQTAADVFKLTALILGRTAEASANILAMQALLDQNQDALNLPMAYINEKWTNAKGQLIGIDSDPVIQEARKNIADSSVQNALLGLSKILKGPITNVSDNLGPKGSRKILDRNLTGIKTELDNFNRIGVVLLGSSGTAIDKILNLKALGGSQLDQQLEQTIRNAGKKMQPFVKASNGI